MFKEQRLMGNENKGRSYKTHQDRDSHAFFPKGHTTSKGKRDLKVLWGTSIRWSLQTIYNVEVYDWQRLMNGFDSIQSSRKISMILSIYAMQMMKMWWRWCSRWHHYPFSMMERFSKWGILTTGNMTVSARPAWDQWDKEVNIFRTVSRASCADMSQNKSESEAPKH